MTAKSIRSKYWEPKHKLLMAFFSNEQVSSTLPITPIAVQGQNQEIHAGQDRHSRRWKLNSNYLWKKVGPRYRLWDVYRKEYVVKNSGEAGTERWKPVSDYYQNKNEFLKGMIVKALKEFWKHNFSVYLQACPDAFSLEGYQYPVTIDIHYHARIPDNGDLDNYSLPYHKTLIDSMVELKMLKDDRIRYINGINLSHTPIEEGSMDQLVKSWGQSANDVITIKIFGNANKL
jgi:Holliday junction resolvase RusA-like endonuclease